MNANSIDQLQVIVDDQSRLGIALILFVMMFSVALTLKLEDFGLVRRIGRVPRRIFQNIALDRRRSDRPVVTLANQGGQHLVFGRCDFHMMKQFTLGQRLAEIERRKQAEAAGEVFEPVAKTRRIRSRR